MDRCSSLSSEMLFFLTTDEVEADESESFEWMAEWNGDGADAI